AEHSARPRRGFDDDRGRLQAGQTGHRTDLPSPLIDQPISVTEMDDHLELSVREDPLAQMGHLSFEVPEEVHQARDMSGPPLGDRPTAERGDDLLADESHGRPFLTSSVPFFPISSRNSPFASQLFAAASFFR